MSSSLFVGVATYKLFVYKLYTHTHTYIYVYVCVCVCACVCVWFVGSVGIYIYIYIYIYQPFLTSRMRHIVNFWAEFNRFEFNAYFLL